MSILENVPAYTLTYKHDVRLAGYEVITTTELVHIHVQPWRSLTKLRDSCMWLYKHKTDRYVSRHADDVSVREKRREKRHSGLPIGYIPFDQARAQRL
jgi:hypothetical protein